MGRVVMTFNTFLMGSNGPQRYSHPSTAAEFSGQESRDPHLYVDLSIEDIDEVEDESWRHRFLFWDEIDDRDGQLIRNKGRKQRYDDGIIVKLKDIGYEYSNLERRLAKSDLDYDALPRKQLRDFKQIFDNYKLSFIELRGIEVAEVCQIFERINQAGQPLSMFDIVVAKTFRPNSPWQKSGEVTLLT